MLLIIFNDGILFKELRRISCTFYKFNKYLTKQLFIVTAQSNNINVTIMQQLLLNNKHIIVNKSVEAREGFKC